VPLDGKGRGTGSSCDPPAPADSNVRVEPYVSWRYRSWASGCRRTAAGGGDDKGKWVVVDSTTGDGMQMRGDIMIEGMAKYIFAYY
jgi:hypothetical protein